MMLDAGDARVTIDPAKGGRVSSLRVGDLDLLVAEDDVDGPMLWGCYPMVPWAGRVRDGRFAFRGTTYELPLDAPPHAIHGVGYRNAWEVTAPGALRLPLDGLWPFGGEVEQRFDLRATSLSLRMAVTATEQAMPIVAGWHPCFRAVVGGVRAEIAHAARSIWERDVAGIPTGRLVAVPPGPWDDSFTDLRGDPRVIWPGVAELTLRSNCPTWVVYDEDSRLVCVEPQTDAPDAFNRDPAVLEPGDQLEINLTLEWKMNR